MKKQPFTWLIIASILTFNACSNEQKEENSHKSIQTEENSPIPWEKDLTTAFKRAKTENKNLIIMAVSKNCKWCRKLKKDTLSNPKVLKRLEPYILVQADRETPNERKALPEFEHVPILFFASPNKEFYDDLRGYYTADELLGYLDEMED